MKTIFDSEVKLEFIERITNICETDSAAWGKMSVLQMLKHNTYWNSWILGKGEFHYKQAFMGRFFGKLALKNMIKDNKPLAKNISSSKQFIIKDFSGDLEFEKTKWISLIKDYATYHNPGFIHDFFGKMSKEQIGLLVYKHTDHHLRQFGR